MASETVLRDQSASRPTRAGLSVKGRLLLAAAVVLTLFAGWEALTSVVAYTSDAYVRSDLVAFSPQVSGHIVAVHVHDNQTVHQGDLLASIDPVPFQLEVAAHRAALVAANAQEQADRDSVSAAQDALAGAKAAQDLAVADQGRTAKVASEGFASRQALDAANETAKRTAAATDAAQAAVSRAQRMEAMHAAEGARAQADLATAEWELSRTQLYAPVNGTINNLTLRVGDTAEVGVPLIGIVDADAFRIIANYKQSYLRAFRPGGTAWVWLDSDPWHLYRARIGGIAQGISRTETKPGLLPYVAPTTDWIRLQRRFPVTLFLADRPPDNRLFMGADARVVIFP